MHIQYKRSTMHLEELPLDVGYMSEKITLTEKKTGKEMILGGQNGKTQLFISAPFMDDALLEELKIIDKELPKGGEHEVNAFFIQSKAAEDDLCFEKIEVFLDNKNEFADFYGTKLVGEPFDGLLTKALILISKDGAIFYDEFLKDLDEKFNLPVLIRKIFAAQTCYTGKGCH